MLNSSHDSASSFCRADGVHKSNVKSVCYPCCLHFILSWHHELTNGQQDGMMVIEAGQ
jgi:hypothetical protein